MQGVLGIRLFNCPKQYLKTNSKRKKIEATNSRKKAKYKLERKESCNKFKEKPYINPKNRVDRPLVTEWHLLCGFLSFISWNLTMSPLRNLYKQLRCCCRLIVWAKIRNRYPKEEMELIITMMSQGGGHCFLPLLVMIGADHHHVVARCSRTFFQSWPSCCRQLELTITLLL